jgi:hypothetical protein
MENGRLGICSDMARHMFSKNQLRQLAHKLPLDCTASVGAWDQKGVGVGVPRLWTKPNAPNYDSTSISLQVAAERALLIRIRNLSEILQGLVVLKSGT